MLVCELCGCADFTKEDGVFVCKSCKTKYSVEEARKIMGSNAVEFPSSNSNELQDLYRIARRAKDDDNAESALRYYDMILLKDPTSWEAAFYLVYFKANNCKIAEIFSAANSVKNNINTVLEMIKTHVSDPNERKKAYEEVASKVSIIAVMLFTAAKNHYDNISISIKSRFTQEFINNAAACYDCLYSLGDNLDSFFGSEAEANKESADAWRAGIGLHKSVMFYFADKEGNTAKINRYAEKIRKYDSSYQVPVAAPSGGCYVATAVYGSYDCPQVWTLRRYRDYTLSKTLYGKVFIKVYYAISPTLVKLFGNTEWFKKMLKPKLDRTVKKLQSDGYESTPYIDKEW